MGTVSRTGLSQWIGTKLDWMIMLIEENHLENKEGGGTANPLPELMNEDMPEE